MIHLTQLQYDTLSGKATEADRLIAIFTGVHLHPADSDAGFLQRNPHAAMDLLFAVKALIAYVPNPLQPARQQGQAALDLVALRHTPNRPLNYWMGQEAAIVGQLLQVDPS